MAAGLTEQEHQVATVCLKSPAFCLPAGCLHDYCQVHNYRRAAEQATRLAEASQRELITVEQQLASQAQCTIKLGTELRHLKQHMQQLHLSVVQPLLLWQNEQQVLGSGGHTPHDATTTSNSSSSKQRALRQWQPPSTITGAVIKSAAAVVEKVLMQHAECGHESEASQQAAQLQHQSRKCQQRLQAKVARLTQQLQEAHAELEAARQEATTAHHHSEELQQQLDIKQLQHAAAAAQQHSSDATAAAVAAEDARDQRQQLQALQQQVNSLLSELACAEGEAAAAQRQVARLQEEQQQGAGHVNERIQQLQDAVDARWANCIVDMRTCALLCCVCVAAMQITGQHL